MMKYEFKGKLRLLEYGQCGEDDFQIARPVIVEVSRKYHEGKVNDDGGRTIHAYQWTMKIKELGCSVSGSDFDEVLGQLFHYIDDAIADGELPYVQDAEAGP